MTEQQDEPLAEGGAATLGGPKDDAGTAPVGRDPALRVEYLAYKPHGV